MQIVRSRRTRSTAVAVVTTALLIGGLLAAAPMPASAGDPNPCETALSADLQISGFEADPCEALIVYSDLKTNDLFLTNTEGEGPLRLTRTKMKEDDPSALFPWIFYNGTKKGETDVYMMSLLDPGHARIRITGLGSIDFDPTAISLFEEQQAVTSAEVDERPMALGPGGLFYPVLLAYSSDRDKGKQGGDCGLEIFMEFLFISGPERVSQCNNVNKFDPEWSNPADVIAYTGQKGNQPFRIHVMGVEDDFDDAITGTDADALFPTWNPFPFSEGGGAPVPGQPAGDESITYTRFGDGAGDSGLFNADGVINDPFFTNTATKLFWESEWSMDGEHFVAVQYNATKSWIVDPDSGQVLTNKSGPYVESLDLMTIESFL